MTNKIDNQTPSITSSPVSGKLLDLSPIQYALYVLGLEVGDKTDAMPLEKIQGIRQIPQEEAKKGDLVAFQDAATKMITHLGIYLGEGRVLSKSGSSVVTRQPIEELLPHGNLIAFFRKP